MRILRSAVQRQSLNGDSLFGSVQWLLPLDGTNGATTTTDASGFALSTTMTACSLTTTGPKWGTACASIGTTSKISATIPAAGTGQFILEGWFLLNATGSTQVLMEVNSYASANGYELYAASGGSINIFGNSGAFTLASAGGVLTAEVWTHIAVKRNASNLVSIWVNGTSVASGTWVAFIGAGISIGNLTAATLGMVGKIDDFRVTHGTDRGATVTVPSAAFPTSL